MPKPSMPKPSMPQWIHTPRKNKRLYRMARNLPDVSSRRFGQATPSHRLGVPEDVAGVAVWEANNLSR